MEHKITASCPGLYRPEGTRILYLNGEITDDIACAFNLLLLEFENEDVNADITLYINSPGGSVAAGLSMIDTMDIVSCDIKTISVGTAASMAAWILMSGTKGKRYALPHSRIILHQPLCGMRKISQVSDIQIMSEEMLRQKRELFSMAVERTGKTYEEIEKDCDRDFYLTAESALEYGIIDSVLAPHKRKSNTESVEMVNL